MKKMFLLFLLSSLTLAANAGPVCNPGKNEHDPKFCGNSATTAATTVPEPSTFALIGLGFAGMTYYRRRK